MYINKRGIALAVLSVALLAGGAWYATGPGYLGNPVVTATVTACQGSGPDRYCVASWPNGHGGTDHGGVSGLTNGSVGQHVKVKSTGDSSATTRLQLGAGGWLFRELIAAVPILIGLGLVGYLIARRRRFTTENPDRRPELSPSAG